MKKFKLDDLNIEKVDVQNIFGGIRKCCIIVPPNGIVSYANVDSYEFSTSLKKSE